MGMADRDCQRIRGIRRLGFAPGSRMPTIAFTWFLSAWPFPTSDFLQVCRIFRHRDAGSQARASVPRACPSFRVEDGFLLMKVSSTAASAGSWAVSTTARASYNWERRSARAVLRST